MSTFPSNTYVVGRSGTIVIDTPTAADRTTHYDIPLYLGDGECWGALQAKTFTVKAIEFRLYPLYNTTDLDNPERSFRIGIEPANIDGVIDFGTLDVVDRIAAFSKLPFISEGVSTTAFHKMMINDRVDDKDTFPIMKLNIREGKVVSREKAPSKLSSNELLNTDDALYQIGVIHLMTSYESMQPFTSAKDDPSSIIKGSSAKAIREAVEVARKATKTQPKPAAGNLKFILLVDYHLEFIAADERSK